MKPSPPLDPTRSGQDPSKSTTVVVLKPSPPLDPTRSGQDPSKSTTVVVLKPSPPQRSGIWVRVFRVEITNS
ncbi:hypothetical protein Tco_0744571 [Tanacetum coccineum]